MDVNRVREFFDQAAREWDSMRSAWYDERVIEELAVRVRVAPTMTVLDLGTGTGFVAAGLAHRVRNVIAVDNSPAMLSVAKQNLGRLAIENVELIEGEVDSVPCPDDSVDAAVANMVLHHAGEPGAMIREMARVTKPGGWVAIADEVEHSHTWMHQEHADLWLGFSRAQISAFFRRAGLEERGYFELGTR